MKKPQFTQLAIAATAAWLMASTVAAGTDRLPAELSKYVQQRAHQDRFSGAVLLARGDRILFEKAYGLADKSNDIKNTIDTKFNLGSMDKMFTAVAIAQLVEAGKLSFDDTIGKYLAPDWVSDELGSKVKISHLLSHTSGIQDVLGKAMQSKPRPQLRKLEDFRPFIDREKLSFEPGTKWAYCNTCFILLGVIVQKASGEDFYEYRRGHIFKPAGMGSTDAYELDLVNRNLAIGYEKEPKVPPPSPSPPSGPPSRADMLRMADQTDEYATRVGFIWRSNSFTHFIKGLPAGGGYSTVHDLLKFSQALLSDKLISRQTRELMWSPKPGSPKYGYGFSLADADGMVGHSGGFSGISTHLLIDPKTQQVLVVLSNYTGGSFAVVAKYLELLPRDSSVPGG